MPLGLGALKDICKRHGLKIRWFDGGTENSRDVVRARFEAPGTVLVNKRLLHQEERLKYDLAFFVGHKILHNGDGMILPHNATQSGEREPPGPAAGMGARDVLYAWREFECSFFAGALLCPRVPFRRFLIREAHSVTACRKIGVTPALVMRRMTAVSPYRHWHFFDAYPPGYLRAVYRANGIPLPWGNMSLVSDPCPRWAVFRLLQDTPESPLQSPEPRSQISIMQDGKGARLYCCHSLLTRDALDAVHVLSVGVDLLPALDNQGYDGEAVVAAIADACSRGGGDCEIPREAAERIRSASQVLNIAWIAAALDSPASVICPRRGGCPRPHHACV
jgi:hypothetical protein